MNLAEYFFQIETCQETAVQSYHAFDFWSMDEQETYYFFTYPGENVCEMSDFTDELCGFTFSSREMRFVDWQTIRPMFTIGLSAPSGFPKQEPLMRHQLIVIRGSCSGPCAKFIRPRNGYAAGLIPPCGPVRQITCGGTSLPDKICILKAETPVTIETARLSSKHAVFMDLLLDAACWASCCQCADAVLWNLDWHSLETPPETHKAYAAIRIKNGQLTVFTGKALERLSRQYCRGLAPDFACPDKLS